MIDSYFKEYTKRYHEMKRTLKKYIDAKSDFYSLTGIRYDDMPKAKGKSLGFDDLMAGIEELYNTYIVSSEYCEEEKKKCQADIDKLDNPIHKIIIEYSFLDFERNKNILSLLKEFHGLEYSYSHLMKLKAQAISKFKEIIQSNTK